MVRGAESEAGCGSIWERASATSGIESLEAAQRQRSDHAIKNAVRGETSTTGTKKQTDCNDGSNAALTASVSCPRVSCESLMFDVCSFLVPLDESEIRIEPFSKSIAGTVVQHLSLSRHSTMDPSYNPQQLQPPAPAGRAATWGKKGVTAKRTNRTAQRSEQQSSRVRRGSVK